MSGAAAMIAVPFRIGARTLFSPRRRMVRVALSLREALSTRPPALPPLAPGDEGWLVTSLPEETLDATIAVAGGRRLVFVRQRYTRYFVDLDLGFDAWWAALSANQRSGLKRKARKLAEASGGALDVRCYRTPEELDAFHALARVISATTYQERLMAAGLPDTPAFRAEMLAAGAAGQALGWILFVGGEPAAYLYCPCRDGAVVYDYLGHDPRFADLSPGAVLQVEAFRTLFAAPPVHAFDFTEGEGQHKRGMASGGIACVDVLLLRPTLGNRALVIGLRAFDGGAALAKRLVVRFGLESLVRRLRRG